MAAKSPAYGDRLGAVLLALALVSIRVLYKAMGMQFDAEPMTWFWQFLDVDQLSGNLGQALLYLHMQPPGLNALVGVGAKVLGPAAAQGFEWLFGALGVAMDAGLFWLVVRLTDNRPLAWAVTLLVATSPVFMIYENHLFNTHLVAALMVLALVFLERTVATGSLRWLLGYGLALVLITLLRSMYHPLWWAALFPLGFLGVKPGRRVIAAGAVLFLVVLAWPLKNYAIFGRFTSSTWLGMNLYNTVYNQSFSPEEMQRYYAGEPRARRRPPGAESSIAVLPPFSGIDSYVPHISCPKTGIAVLDAPYRRYPGAEIANLNSLIYLKASDIYLQDYLSVVRADPMILSRVFASSLRAFFRPATDNEVLPLDRAAADNLRNFRGLLAFFDTVFYWRFADGGRGPNAGQGVSPALVLGYLFVLVWCPIQMTRSIRGRTAILGFIALNALYALVVGNLFENYENMRFRFETEPLIVIACAVALGDLVGRRRPAGPVPAGR